MQDEIEALVNSFTALKTGGPCKEPPVIPAINRNPRRHDVVAWRRDGLGLDSSRYETKELALEHGRGLPWIIYYQYAVMAGRDMIEKHAIAIPAGMAITDEGLPVAV